MPNQKIAPCHRGPTKASDSKSHGSWARRERSPIRGTWSLAAIERAGSVPVLDVRETGEKEDEAAVLAASPATQPRRPAPPR